MNCGLQIADCGLRSFPVIAGVKRSIMDESEIRNPKSGIF